MRNTPRPTPPAPTDLGQDGRALWSAVLAEFEIEPHNLFTLHAIATQLDRAAEARAEIAAQGLFIPGRRGQVTENPAAGAERAALRMARTLQRELGLQLEPADSGYSRAPALASHGPSARAK